MNETQEPAAVDSDSPPVAMPAIGSLLREAREARGLSVDDVVQALKFSPRQIASLEADDLAALPGNVFVRGMVRSYARFVKLDPEPLLASLDTRAPTSVPEVRPPDNMGNAMPKAGVRQIPPLVALSIVLLIAAAVMIAWHFLGGPLPQRFVPATSVPERPAERTADAAPPMPAPQAVAEPAAAPAPQTPTTTAPATPAAAALPAGARELVFDFHGTSWIEVKDASEQIILTGQYADGARQTVAGRPPFQIVVGNAAAVGLRYEDQTVDLKPYIRAEVARLTLQ